MMAARAGLYYARPFSSRRSRFTAKVCLNGGSSDEHLIHRNVHIMQAPEVHGMYVSVRMHACMCTWVVYYLGGAIEGSSFNVS